MYSLIKDSVRYAFTPTPGESTVLLEKSAFNGSHWELSDNRLMDTEAAKACYRALAKEGYRNSKDMLLHLESQLEAVRQTINDEKPEPKAQEQADDETQESQERQGPGGAGQEEADEPVGGKKSEATS